MKIPKPVKVAGLVIIVILVATIAFSAIISTDLWSNFATGSEKLTPVGEAAGHALVVYNPGLFGAAKDAATKIAGNLASRGYEVRLAGIKSGIAAHVSGYDVVVAGGPIYGGKVSSSVRSYLTSMSLPANVTVGAFATGSFFKDQVTEPFTDPARLKSFVLLFEGDDADEKCAVFVDALLMDGV
jgi:menaquinone-dependent protoporphyrinogen IX oxidase